MSNPEKVVEWLKVTEIIVETPGNGYIIQTYYGYVWTKTPATAD